MNTPDNIHSDSTFEILDFQYNKNSDTLLDYVKVKFTHDYKNGEDPTTKIIEWKLDRKENDLAQIPDYIQEQVKLKNIIDNLKR